MYFVYGIFEPDDSRGARRLAACTRAGGRARSRSATGSGPTRSGAGPRDGGVAGVLTRVGFEHFGLHRVDLSVDPENERSAKIPRKLGFVEEGRLRRRLPPKTEGGPRRDQVMFSLLAEELAGSPCLEFEYVAYDALGREL